MGNYLDQFTNMLSDGISNGYNYLFGGRKDANGNAISSRMGSFVDWGFGTIGEGKNATSRLGILTNILGTAGGIYSDLQNADMAKQGLKDAMNKYRTGLTLNFTELGNKMNMRDQMLSAFDPTAGYNARQDARVAYNTLNNAANTIGMGNAMDGFINNLNQKDAAYLANQNQLTQYNQLKA